MNQTSDICRSNQENALKVKAFLLICCLLLGCDGFAQQPESRLAEKCSIEGRVVRASDGEPVRNARVQAFKMIPEPKEFHTATDATGKFALRDLEPGSYALYVERSGFVKQEYRESSEKGGRLGITLEAGQRRDDIVVRLLATGVISGRVFDSEGEPLTNIYVSAVQPMKSGTRTIKYVKAGASSDDQGAFRIHGLKPGRYFVRASSAEIENHQTLRQNAAAAGENGFEMQQPTYFPGTMDLSRATRVEVRPGEDVRIDLTLLTARLFSVTGRVQRPPGAKPKLETQLWLRPKDDDEEPGSAHIAPIDGPNGEFDIAGVRPGSYVLTAIITHEEKMYRARQEVEVRGQDVDGLLLVPMPGIEVRGRVRAEQGVKLDFKKLRVELGAKDELLGGQSGAADIDAEGSYVLKDVMDGEYFVAVLGLSAEGLYLRSAHAGKSNALKSGVSISGGNAPGLLELIVGRANSSVDGVVLNDSGQPVPMAAVILMSEDEERMRESMVYRQAFTNSEGHFQFPSLPPGEFIVFALESLMDLSEDGDPIDSDALKAWAKKVKVGESGKQTLELKPFPKGKANPPN